MIHVLRKSGVHPFSLSIYIEVLMHMNSQLKIYLIAVLLASVSLGSLQAQILERKVFASQGGTITTGPYYFSFTIGEPIIGTDDITLPILTKGFEQPIDPSILSLIRRNQLAEEVDFQYKIYPNPAHERVTFSYSSSTESAKEVSIVNALGQVFHMQTVESQLLATGLAIDLSTIPVGAYWLVCSDLGKKSIFPLRKE